MELHGGNIYKAARKLGIKKQELLDFSSNINPLGIPQSVRDIIHNSIDELTAYPELDYSRLREALAAHNSIQPERLTPGNGAIELIYLYLQQLKPRKTLITAPTFSEYSRALASVDCRVEHFPLCENAGFALNSTLLTGEIRSGGYDLVIICNPSNPTGRFTPLEEIERLSQAAAAAGSRLMVDESFIDFTGEMQRQSAILLRAPHIFVIRSLTKFFALPGLRIGYALSYDREMLASIESRRAPWSINSLAALATEVALKGKDYINRSIAFIKEEKERLYCELNKIEGIKPYHPAVNFILIKLEGSLRSGELRERLLKRKILIREAGNFEGLDDSFIRVAVKSREDNNKLLEALRAEV